jgi:general secretion pathway protein D
MEDFEIVALEHASASDVVRVLQTLDAPTPGEDFTKRPGIIADQRTNTVILRGDPQSRSSLRDIIKRLDMPAEDGATQVHYLRYSKAEEVAEVLRGIVEGRLDPGAGSASSIQSSAGDTGGSSNNQQLNIQVQAHESTNSVVIYGPAELSREMASIIRQLDIRRAQVLVEAVIAEVSYDRAKELGVQWGIGSENGGIGIINFNRGASGSIINLAAAGSAFADGSVTAPPSLGNGLSLGGFGNIGSTQIALLVSALQGDSSSNILSTPSLMTLDNEEAEIVVGQNVPFIVGRSIEESGQAFDTIERQDVGIKLRITPQINEGSAVRLEIEQEVSQIAAGATDAADIITNKRSLKTTVMVDDNQLIVLGGLIDDQLVETRDKVPGLGDIPFLGALFRYDTARTEKRNLMVFLRPVIIRDAATAADMTQSKYTYIRDRQVEAQNREDSLLPGERPILPDWNYLLSLPPPFENAITNAAPAPVSMSIPKPPTVSQ